MADQTESRPILQGMVEQTSSISAMRNGFQTMVDQTFKDVQKIFEGMAYPIDMQLIYYREMYIRFKDSLNDMLAEAQSKKQLLSESIENLLKQITVLYSELHLDIMPKTYDQVPLCKVEQMLKTHLQNLECIKKERMMIQQEMLVKEHVICKRLDYETQGFLANIIPSAGQLVSFKLFLQELEYEKEYLEEVFTDMRCSVIKLMDDLDTSPSSSFEQLICNNPEEFVLSASNMTKLREFRDELNMRVKNMGCNVERIKED